MPSCCYGVVDACGIQGAPCCDTCAICKIKYHHLCQNNFWMHNFGVQNSIHLCVDCFPKHRDFEDIDDQHLIQHKVDIDNLKDYEDVLEAAASGAIGADLFPQTTARIAGTGTPVHGSASAAAAAAAATGVARSIVVTPANSTPGASTAAPSAVGASRTSASTPRSSTHRPPRPPHTQRRRHFTFDLERGIAPPPLIEPAAPGDVLGVAPVLGGAGNIAGDGHEDRQDAANALIGLAALGDDAAQDGGGNGVNVLVDALVQLRDAEQIRSENQHRWKHLLDDIANIATDEVVSTFLVELHKMVQRGRVPDRGCAHDMIDAGERIFYIRQQNYYKKRGVDVSNPNHVRQSDERLINTPYVGPKGRLNDGCPTPYSFRGTRSYTTKSMARPDPEYLADKSMGQILDRLRRELNDHIATIIVAPDADSDEAPIMEQDVDDLELWSVLKAFLGGYTEDKRHSIMFFTQEKMQDLYPYVKGGKRGIAIGIYRLVRWSNKNPGCGIKIGRTLTRRSHDRVNNDHGTYPPSLYETGDRPWVVLEARSPAENVNDGYDSDDYDNDEIERGIMPGQHELDASAGQIQRMASLAEGFLEKIVGGILECSTNVANVHFPNVYGQLHTDELPEVEEEITSGEYDNCINQDVYAIRTTCVLNVYREMARQDLRSTSSYQTRQYERRFYLACKMMAVNQARNGRDLPLPPNGHLQGFFPSTVVRMSYYLYRQKKLWEERKLHSRRAEILFSNDSVRKYVTEKRGGVLLDPLEIWELNFQTLIELKAAGVDFANRYDGDDLLDSWLYRQMYDTFHCTIDPKKLERLVELFEPELDWTDISNNRVCDIRGCPKHWERRSERGPEDLYADGRHDCGGCDGRHPKNKIQTMVCPGCEGTYDNMPECIQLSSFQEAVDMAMGENNWLCSDCALVEEHGG